MLSELRAVVGDAHVLTDPSLTAGYVSDWTRRFMGTTPAVVRPASTAEVAGVLRVCAAYGATLVPRVATPGSSAEQSRSATKWCSRWAGYHAGARRRRCRQVTLGAGVTLAAAQAHARAAGLEVGTDLAARDSCTLGGLVATNAGGLQVLRWGSVRSQVAGLEAVLADGSVVSRARWAGQGRHRL